MKKLMLNLRCLMPLLFVSILTTSCESPSGTNPPPVKPPKNKFEDLKANVPDIVRGPDGQCSGVASVTFYGEQSSPGFTNWFVAWSNTNITTGNYNYEIKLFDKLIPNMPIWTWITPETSLVLGVLPGNPDNSPPKYHIIIKVFCPSISTPSPIVVEDVAMK